MAKHATIKVRQTGSAMRRHYDQRQNLIGLGLNRIGRVAEVPDTPASRGMMTISSFLVRIRGLSMQISLRRWRSEVKALHQTVQLLCIIRGFLGLTNAGEKHGQCAIRQAAHRTPGDRSL